MSLIIPANTLAAAGGFEVANSLRFNRPSSDYLNRTLGTPTDIDKATFSTWIKFSDVTSSNDTAIFSATADGNNTTHLEKLGSQVFRLNMREGSSYIGVLTTNRVFRDPSAWYHIVVAFDTTQGTASNRIKLYINGVQETSFSTATYPDQNVDLRINTSGQVFNIGSRGDTGNHPDAYFAETVFVDGLQLAADSFGEFDEDSGIFKPIDVSGLTFGNNGFYLDFEDSAALGDDVSGNGNDFTVNNLTAIDQTTDTPTNNFCTLNPLDVCDDDGRTLSEGNLDFNTSSGNNGTISGTLAVYGAGKWYFETKILAQSGASGSAARYGIVGVKDINVCSFSAGDAYYIYSDGRKEDGVNTTSSAQPGYSTGDIVQVALDLDGGNIYFGLNGDWGDNDGNFNQTFGNATAFFSSISTSKFWTPYLQKNVTADNVLTLSANLGNPTFSISSGNADGNGHGNFEYLPPSGFLSLCTKNLSEILS